MSLELYVRPYAQQDPRLGRHVTHDERSFSYEHQPRMLTVSGDVAWEWKIYQPKPNPRQKIGCCTGVDQCVRANAQDNRVPGVILGMRDAVRIYTRATELDDRLFPGRYPGQDTGSSSLFAAKAARELGIIERYEWIFAGVDAVITALRSKPVGVGTRWDERMFHPDPTTYEVTPGGDVAGGHQWTVVGYDPASAMFTGRCWWGPTFGREGRFRISKASLAELLADDGDAQVTYRKTV